MIHVNYWAIVVGALLVIVFSALYYFVLNRQVMALRSTKASEKDDVRTKISLNNFLIEFVRTFALGLVVAYAVSLLEITQLHQAAVLALWLWVGFPVVIFTGLVLHEHFTGRLAAIHAGDWLGKLLILTILLTFWR